MSDVMSAADSSIRPGVLSRPGILAGPGAVAGQRIGRHRSPLRAVLSWRRMFYRARHAW